MKFSVALKNIFTYVACLMLALSAPVTAFAEELAPTTEPTIEPQPEVTATPPAPEPGPAPVASSEPVAPIAPVAPAPAAPIAPEPAQPNPPKVTYTYDAETQKWNSNRWQWDRATNRYVRVTTQVVESSAVPPEVASTSLGGTSLQSSTNTSIANALDSIATSGAAAVKNNTKGGNATSGNASASTTIINNVNSTMSNTNNTEAATFVMDVMGDVNGDIMLEPMLLKAMLEAKVTEEGGSTQMSMTTDTHIQNDINLTATSGNATVSGNTTGGDATTGTANTMANVMNIVNSMIAANQSFDGTINIYGNLNGDILIAPDFLAQMLANNGIQASASGATQLNARDTQEIVNNVSLAAESGAALVAGNTRAGDATSGSAETNLVIFNMTGHEIVAANSLLVFINVLGSWVGVIVDAPVGATAAAIGSGVTQNNIQPSLVVDATNNTKITNNINLGSYSGDASVTGNTEAGSATSGNATASANIANISNSSMGLTGWFGRLFINVFGSWNGSFGVNTSAGDPIQQGGSGEANPQVIRFVPREENVNRTAVQRLRIVTPTQTQPAVDESSDVKQASVTEPAVLAATNTSKSDIPTQQSYIDARKELNIPMLAASVVLIIASGYILRRFLF
jgi:hypothetical protein